MKIEKIKKLSNNKYKLVFINNDSLTLYEDVILDNSILFKKDIDDNLLNKIIEDNKFYEVYNKTLKYVLTKMRSTYEIEKYLEKYEISLADKEKIVNKLKNINLLNDKMYAEAYISDKINLSNDGPLKIKNELLCKKVDESIIESELEKYDKEIFIEKIKKLISKKKNTKYSNYVFKQKLNLYLINLGYESSDIIPLLNDVEIDTSLQLKKDYDNLYRKLSRKYIDKQLDYEINSRLYKKGYSMDEINNIKRVN